MGTEQDGSMTRQMSSATRAVTFLLGRFGHCVLALSLLLTARVAAAPVEDVVHFYHVDPLGSVRAVTDMSGEVVSRHDYLPFGEDIPCEVGGRDQVLGYCGHEADPSLRFTGKERDPETGLDYFGARYYSGVQGRFTVPDTPFADQHVHDPQSWNLYSYVRNNPLRYRDPTGQCLRGYYETWESCGQYVLGAAKAVGNIPSDIVNSPNRLTNLIISPLTDFRFGDLVPTTFPPANADQEDGALGVQVALIVAPFAEVAAGAMVGEAVAPSSGGRIGSTRHIKLDSAPNGSYTIEFDSGKGYAGKGGTTRARRSARQRSRANDDPVTSIDHTEAATDAEAFAQEAARLEALGGAESPNTYNKINSPGRGRAR